jgi:peptidoglycan/xylan/chitin deacetylase (PgdA/CDA1 family)
MRLPLPALAASCLALAVVCTPGIRADERDPMRFLSVVMHDVVDERAALDADSITTSDLVAFFEYLVSNHWHALRLDEIERARRGDAVLPDRSILITADDAYASDYTRLYPLLLAYRMHALIAVEGEWIEAGVGPGGSKHLTWNQAREMQASGLVEFISHGYALHTAIRGNPQGSMLPAFAYRLFDPVRGYEQEDGYRERITEDLQRSRALMARELGQAPRAIAWPYGRYTRLSTEAAAAVGFRFGLTFDPEPADARRPMTIPRFSLSSGSLLAAIVENLRANGTRPRIQRLVGLRVSSLYRADPAETERLLGAAIERVRTMGATAVVMEGVETGPDGRLEAWFPTTHLPVRADVYLRFAWQFQTRAGVRVYGRIPVVEARAATGSDEATMALFRDFGVFTSMDGLLFKDMPTITAGGDAGAGQRWDTRQRRNAIDVATISPKARLAFACFRAVENRLPGLLLVVMTSEIDPRGPAVAADLTLVRTTGSPRDAERLASRMEAAGWLNGEASRRAGLWIESGTPPREADLSAITRAFQRRGGTTVGWADDDPIGDHPKATVIAPAVSASIFPLRF